MSAHGKDGDQSDTGSADSTGTVIVKPETESKQLQMGNVDQPLTSEDENTGARSRVFTDKGRAHSEDQLEKIYNTLKTLTLKVNRMLADKEPYEKVRLRHSEWMESYEHFCDSHNKHLSKLKSPDKENYMDVHNQRETFLLNFKVAIQDYLNDQSSKTPIHVGVKTAGSVATQSTGSSVLSTKRLQAEEKRIELEAKKQALSKKRQIEMAKVSLRMQEEELEIETDMAVTDAKAKVYDKFEQGEYTIQPVQVKFDMKQSNQKDILQNFNQTSSKSDLNPNADRFVPSKNTSDDSSNIQHNDDLPNASTHDNPGDNHSYVDHDHEETFPQHSEMNMNTNNSEAAFQAMIQHLKKPTTEIKKFAGNPLEYRKFLRQFHAKVVLNCENDEEKMNFLEQLTYGEANKVVSGYSHLPGTIAYKAAMDQLDDRYGDTDVMASAFIKKALEWPNIRNGDIKSLDEFALFLVECQNGAESIQTGSVLEYSENIKRLLSKLPFHLHDRWRNIVMRLKDSHKTVKFKDFVNFVKTEAKKVNDPTYGHVAIKDLPVTSHDKNVRRGLQKSGVSNAAVKNEQQQYNLQCTYCDTNKSTHTTDRCRRLMSESREHRIAHLKSKGLCFGCLKKGHMSNKCTNRLQCNICKRKHPTLLHNENYSPEKKQSSNVDGKQIDTPECKNTQSEHSFVCSQGQLTETSDVSCAMAIIPVRVKLKNKVNTVETYAFFDSGSSVSFCTERLMHQLGAHGKKQQITISTMGNSQTINTYGLSGLQISDLDMEHSVDLPKLYTKDKMPVSRSHIPTEQEIRKWTHLESVEIPVIDAEIGIMIGSNVPDAYTPFDVLTGPPGSPHATRTRLGWIAWNVLRDNSDTVENVNSFIVNRAYISAVEESERTNHLDKLVEKSMNMEFPERLIDDKREDSVNDVKFLECVKQSLQYENEHYTIALPFKDQKIKLQNNASQAMQRLKSLKAKMCKNSKFKDDYTKFMNKLLDKGYMESVPKNQLERDDGRVWYIPHHGVYHSKKPDKIRVVFDCSATYLGVSLNKELLQGPDLTNNLLGILMRFRQENVAVLGDIEAMFYQVKVPPMDRDCLRFFWWPNGNLDNEPEQFRMTVHIFGATSSPSCCNFALKQTVEDFGKGYSSYITETILKGMYVDDCLQSVPTVPEAISLVKDVTALCMEGGFNLTKWICNDSEVLESIPQEHRAPSTEEWNFSNDSPIERALGVSWFVRDDELGFNINVDDMTPTRRGILSVVSSVYDPIGIASPFILTAKSILQTLCKNRIGWDEEIPAKELLKWNNWLSQLKDLEKVKLYRCYKPKNFGHIASCQLHCFADACDIGYGCVFYMRLIDHDENIHCSFVLGKSRVAPLKSVTIPRMELTAATSAVRLSRMITKEISYSITDTFYWTDIMAVLRYIANTKTRFHTFVANRLAIIHDATEVNQWNFIGTKQNPADLASRGTSIDKFICNQQWLNGPDFLWNCESDWPKVQTDTSVLINDPEVRKSEVVCTTLTENEGVERLIQSFSDWNKLKRITAWFLVAKEKFRNKSKTAKKCDMLNSEIVEQAGIAIIKYIQQKHFKNLIESLTLKRNSSIKTELKKLDPFVDSRGLLRVGGRLERSDIPYDSMHPIILPKDSPVSRIIIDNIHRTIGHLGKNSILTVLRQTFWILGANMIIKNLVSKCVVCRKYQRTCEKQRMANLPKERLQADDPPFTRTGIDFFGPFEVKQGRSTVKRYGVIFTCLNIRAIHLELAFSLDTDSCINAIRRFIARRGTPSFIRTDNGTNFVGSEKELRQEIQKWNKTQIQDFLIQRHIQWEFNPPAGSHFGGIWERLIRSVRKVLYSVMHEQNIRISDEGLMTLFCEVESILNGRPITELSSDINDLNILTPNHLLLQRPGESFPPGTFSKTDNYVKRRWKQIQYLADLFWSRWRTEYLPLLQKRQKWTKPVRNIQVDDIVLLSENSPRNSWNMGRVIEVVRDKENVVRIAKVKTENSVLTRPIAKLCLLLGD